MGKESDKATKPSDNIDVSSLSSIFDRVADAAYEAVKGFGMGVSALMGADNLSYSDALEWAARSLLNMRIDEPSMFPPGASSTGGGSDQINMPAANVFINTFKEITFSRLDSKRSNLRKRAPELQRSKTATASTAGDLLDFMATEEPTALIKDTIEKIVAKCKSRLHFKNSRVDPNLLEHLESLKDHKSIGTARSIIKASGRRLQRVEDSLVKQLIKLMVPSASLMCRLHCSKELTERMIACKTISDEFLNRLSRSMITDGGVQMRSETINAVNRLFHKMDRPSWARSWGEGPENPKPKFIRSEKVMFVKNNFCGQPDLVIEGAGNTILAVVECKEYSSPPTEAKIKEDMKQLAAYKLITGAKAAYLYAGPDVGHGFAAKFRPLTKEAEAWVRKNTGNMHKNFSTLIKLNRPLVPT